MIRTTRALLLVGLTCSCATGRHPTGQDVEWFRSGFYAGVMAGEASLDASSSDLDDVLAALGYTGSTDVDDSDFAFALFGGYRFEEPFAVEVGYANLGEVDSTVQTNAADPQSVLGAVVDEQPFLGRGFFLTGRWFPVDETWIQVGVGGGAWIWEADVEAETGGVRVKREEDGIDPILGLTLLVDLVSWLQLRAEYDLYFLDGEEAGVLMAGLQFDLGGWGRRGRTPAPIGEDLLAWRP